MSFSAEEIGLRLRLGEDSHWEFKQFEFRGDRPIGPDRDSLADALAAFANGNGGVMLCGVTDDGRIQGMTRGQLDETERTVGRNLLGLDQACHRHRYIAFRA